LFATEEGATLRRRMGGSDYRSALGTAVRVRRERAKLTSRQLARHSGLSEGTVSRIESGKTDPTWATVRRLAAALGASVAEIAADAERLGS
jgi:transcriptional regulator with XRE-family HTH domain